MLECEGYKMFKGEMKILPKNGMEPFIIDAVWLYKPEFECWYGQGRSFPKEICEPQIELGD